MKRWVLAAGAALGLLSCSANVPGVGCGSDADCGGGARCHQEVCVSEPAQCTGDAECFSGRICFEGRCAPDTRPERCAPTCGSYEECVEGGCAPGFERVELLAPSPGTMGPSGEVRVQLVRRTDGVAEAPPGLVLIVEEEGAAPRELALSRGQGLQYSALLEFPAGGIYRLRARLPALGLESAPVTVAYNSCASACPEFTECAGRACLPYFEGLRFLEPAAGAVGPRVRLKLQAVRRTGSGPSEPPAEVTVTATPQGGGTSEELRLARAAGTEDYVGEWQPLQEAAYTVNGHTTAPSLESGSLTLTVDKSGPNLSIWVTPPTRQPHEVDTALEHAYRRDEQATLFVTGPADVDAASVRLKVSGTAGEVTVPLQPAGDSCPTEDSGYCAVGFVDLWQAPLEMKAARASFKARAKGLDGFGNEGLESEASIPVTRFKWAVDLQGGAIKTSPAIGSNGDVYVGTANTPGKAVAVRPDGTVKWSFTTGGPVLASVLIGEVYGKETVFVAGKAVGGNSGAIWAIEPEAQQLPEPVALNESRFSVGLAFSSTSHPTIWVLATSAAGLQVLGVELRLTGSNRVSWLDETASAIEGATLVIAGTQLVYGDSQARINSIAFSGGNLSQRPGFPISLGPGGLAYSTAMAEEMAVTATSSGALVQIPLSGGNKTSYAADSRLWNPSIPIQGIAVLGTESKYLVSIDLATNIEKARLLLGGVAASTPAAGSDGRLYAPTRAGSLTSTDRNLTQQLWTLALGQEALNHCSLDCSRDASGIAIPGRPGVLYVGSDDGKLYALVTDSRGIDTQAPWPKFQHDPRNTGNADTDLAQFECP